jgi:hypothetical protein
MAWFDHLQLRSISAACFLNALQKSLPLLLQDISLQTRLRMWFQQDCAPTHVSLQGTE